MKMNKTLVIVGIAVIVIITAVVLFMSGVPAENTYLSMP